METFKNGLFPEARRDELQNCIYIIFLFFGWNYLYAQLLVAIEISILLIRWTAHDFKNL